GFAYVGSNPTPSTICRERPLNSIQLSPGYLNQAAGRAEMRMPIVKPPAAPATVPQNRDVPATSRASNHLAVSEFRYWATKARSDPPRIALSKPPPAPT